MINEKLKPLLSAQSILFALCSATLSIILFTSSAPAEASAIQNGSLIKIKNSDEMYIVKKTDDNKQYKRLVINPSVLNNYDHLNTKNAIVVSKSASSQYKTSHLIRIQGSDTVYELRPSQNSSVGVKHPVNVTQNQFVQAGLDPDSVFPVSRSEGSSRIYITGSARTAAYYPKLRLTDSTARTTQPAVSTTGVKISKTNGRITISKSKSSTTPTRSAPKPTRPTPATTSTTPVALPASTRKPTTPAVVVQAPQNYRATQEQFRVLNASQNPATQRKLAYSALTAQPISRVKEIVRQRTTPSFTQSQVTYPAAQRVTSLPTLSARPAQPARTPAPAPASVPYNGSKFISQAALLSELRKYSWDTNLAYRIAVCESSRNVRALNNTPGREYSVGLFQINLRAHRNLSEQALYNPVENIRQAYDIYRRAGWNAWKNCYRKVTS